jgi:hypothetical protein
MKSINSMQFETLKRFLTAVGFYWNGESKSHKEQAAEHQEELR